MADEYILIFKPLSLLQTSYVPGSHELFISDALYEETLKHPDLGLDSKFWKDVAGKSKLQRRIREHINHIAKINDKSSSQGEASVLNEYENIDLRLQKQAPADYVHHIRAFSENTPALKDKLALAICQTFVNEPQTSGGRWYQQLHPDLRAFFRKDLGRLLSAINSSDYICSYSHWIKTAGYTEHDLPDDAIVLPTSTAADPAADVEAPIEPVGPVAPPFQVGISKMVTDRNITPEEEAEFWARRRELLPRLPGNRSGRHGELPQHPVKAPKTAENPTGSWTLHQLAGLPQAPPTTADESQAKDEVKELVTPAGTVAYSGASYPRNFLLMHGEVFGFNYAADTINRIGADVGGLFTTDMRIVAKHFRKAYLEITYRILSRDTRVDVCTVKIPFGAMTGGPPKAVELDASELQQQIPRMVPPSAEGEAPISGIKLQFTADTTMVDVFENHDNIRDLKAAGFPRLVDWLSHVRKIYNQSVQAQDFTMFVSTEWRDFHYWVLKMADFWTASDDDPLAGIRLKASDSVIESKSLVKDLPRETEELAPLFSFASVDEQITILSDGVLREARLQELHAEALSFQELDVLVQPIGPNTVPVQHPGNPNVTIQQSYFYLVSIMGASDYKKFVEHCPPIGSTVALEIGTNHMPAVQDIREKTDQEKAEIIGKEIFNAMKDIERIKIPHVPDEKPDMSKDEKEVQRAVFREKYRVNQAAMALRPFIRTFTRVDSATVVNAQDKIAQNLAQAMGVTLQRERDNDIVENDRTWQERIVEFLKQDLLQYLELPRKMTSETPKWIGQRVEPWGDLMELSRIHIIVTHPVQPGWDKQSGPAPFIFVMHSQIPAAVTTTNVVPHCKSHSELWFKAIMIMAIHDKTTRERIKGINMLNQHKKYSVFAWAASPHRVTPATTNLFLFYVLLDLIRHGVLLYQLPFPDDAPPSPAPQTPEDILLANYIQYAKNLDADQMAVFLSFDKVPFNTLFIQGCPGSGKSTLAYLLTSIIQDSKLLPQEQLTLDYPAEKSDVVDSGDDLDAQQDDEYAEFRNFPFVRTHIGSEKKDEPMQAPSADTPAAVVSNVNEDETPEPAAVSRPIVLPPLPFGPPLAQVKAWASEEGATIESVLDQIHVVYHKACQTKICDYVDKTFVQKFNKSAEHLPEQALLECRWRLQNDMRLRLEHKANKHWDQWVTDVRCVLTGDEDTVLDDYYATEKNDQQQQLPPQEVEETTPIALTGQQEIDASLHQTDILAGKNPDAVTVTAEALGTFTSLPKQNKVMINVQRNAHAIRAAEDYMKMTEITGAGTGRTRRAIKVNDLIGEEKRLTKGVRGLRKEITVDNNRTSVGDILMGHVGMMQLHDKLYNKSEKQRIRTGDIWSLNATVSKMINKGKAPELKRLLDQIAPGCPYDEAIDRALTKCLLDLYREILSGVDIVICTPVVASMLADKGLFYPDVIVLDESSMMPEADSILVTQQFGQARLFIYAGDHYQGGVVSLSQDNRPPRGELQSSLNGQEAMSPEEYATKKQILDFVNPFAPQFTKSLLWRMDRATPERVGKLMINHRQEGGLERIAARIAYGGRMVAARDPGICGATASKLHEFLSMERTNLMSQRVTVSKADTRNGKKGLSKFGKETGDFAGNRLTVWMEGTPEQYTKSWTNLPQCEYALHLAAKVQQSGIPNRNGEVLGVMIITPYADAATDLRRLARKMGPWEHCREKLRICTIDEAHGDEEDFVITAFINPNGGFLWRRELLIVAQTRPRYGAVDIMAEKICNRRSPEWSHFRTYKSLQESVNATVEERRDWNNLNNTTWMPCSTSIDPISQWCFACAREGHHPRNHPGAGPGLAKLVCDNKYPHPPSENQEDEYPGFHFAAEGTDTKSARPMVHPDVLAQVNKVKLEANLHVFLAEKKKLAPEQVAEQIKTAVEATIQAKGGNNDAQPKEEEDDEEDEYGPDGQPTGKKIKIPRGKTLGQMSLGKMWDVQENKRRADIALSKSDWGSTDQQDYDWNGAATEVQQQDGGDSWGSSAVNDWDGQAQSSGWGAANGQSKW